MNYDFAAAVTALKDQGLDLPRTDLVGDETYEAILYKFMGYLRLSETSKDQFILLMNRLPRVQIPDSKQDTQPLPAVDGYLGIQDKAPAAVGSVASGSISETDPDNWKYTSLLWEKGQMHNTTPVCTETCLSNFPTRFRVTIQFKGVQGSGDARNKRLAKHIAARAVCQALGFRPS
ncbi:hypothetical protein AWENTII_012848 [Aspergillus wentii]|nr:hypothetical protein MW887_005884 [Aspergillus wentii]